MSDTRARRDAKPGAKAKASFAQFQELKRTGGKRIHNFELKEEEAVYDEVQEQDYAKLVQDRREEAGKHLYCSHGLDVMLFDCSASLLQVTSLLMTMVWAMLMLVRRKTGESQ